MATDWPPTTRGHRLFEGLLTLAIPRANPDYELAHVREWLIEFDDDDMPGREIGLDAQGNVVLAGPDDRNYGFWLDTNMKWADFSGEPITAEVFEAAWEGWRGWSTQRRRGGCTGVGCLILIFVVIVMCLWLWRA